MKCANCEFEVAEGVSYCIRCGQALAKPQAKGRREQINPPYVMIVEDDAACTQIISDYLGSHGVAWRVSCRDAQEAAVQARTFNIGIVLMDIMLPRFGSGVDAYRLLREDPGLSKDLPVVFYTAMNAQKAGSMMPSHDPNVRLLFKPLDLAVVLHTIRALAGKVFQP